MTRSIASAAVVLFFFGPAACRTTPAPATLEQENDNLHGTIGAQQRRIDELVAEKVDLDRRVKGLEAKVSKMDSTERVVEEAKGAISAQVKQILERFKGDMDVEVLRTNDGYKFVLREAVLFETASAKLTDAGRVALRRVADALRGGEPWISIEGHTDDVRVAKPETLKKFPHGNMDLSVQRSISVWEFLVREGKVAESRVSVAGFGPHRPIVPNSNNLNRQRNRRVEIRVAERR